MSVVVSVDAQMVEEVQRKLGQFSNKAPNAISSALNRAVTNVTSNVSKEVRKQYHIKAGDVKSTLNTRKASTSKLQAEVRSKGELIPLDRFKVSPRTVQPKRKKQLKIAVKKDGFKKILGAFIADLSGVKVFKRQGKDRLPINRLFGPSVPQMLRNEGIVENINEEAKNTFERRLDHEINRILASVGGGSR